jgi:hypothetical protein
MHAMEFGETEKKTINCVRGLKSIHMGNNAGYGPISIQQREQVEQGIFIFIDKLWSMASLAGTCLLSSRRLIKMQHSYE